jgi:hypothetical protein
MTRWSIRHFLTHPTPGHRRHHHQAADHHRLNHPFDAPYFLVAGYDRKVAKYGNLGPTFPFVVGALCSWLPTNNKIDVALSIRPSAWIALRRKCRLLAATIINHQQPTNHQQLAGHPWTRPGHLRSPPSR